MLSAFDPPVRKKDKSEGTLVSELGPNPSSLCKHPFTSREDLNQDSCRQNQVEVRDIPGKHRPIPVANTTSDLEDTEDEEVKINCMGGLSGVRDSDMSSDESSNDDKGESEDMDSDGDLGSDGESGDAGLVNFVSSKVGQAPESPGIRRPTPVGKSSQQIKVVFSPDLNENDHEETMSDSEGSSSSSSSSGARGIGLYLETSTPVPSGDDRASSDDSDSDEEDRSEGGDESISDVGSEMSSDNDSQAEDDKSDASADIEVADDDDDLNVSSDDEPGEELHVDENDAGRDAMAITMPMHETTDSWDASATGDMAGDSSHQRPPSLTVDEIEDMLDVDTSGDLSANDTSKSEACNKPSEELKELLSDSLEFDYWSSETLAAAVNELSSASVGMSSEERCSPIQLPPRDNCTFWIDRMGLVIFPELRLKKYLVDNPDHRVSASRLVFDAFERELMSLDLTHVKILGQNENCSKQATEMTENSRDRIPQLFVGSFSAAESRLALAVLNIKRVVQISYHPLDELWVSDGVEYSTHILPSLGNGGAAPVHEAIQEAAEEVSSALRGDSGSGAMGSLLVACSTGDEHSCAVCAVYFTKRYCISTTEAIAMMVEQRSSCSIDPEWLNSGNTPDNEKAHKTKRVLSSNYLLSGLDSAQGLGFDSPKRMRCVPANMPLLPTLNLGPAAHESSGPALQMKGSEDYASSSTEEEEERQQDMRLSEELEDTCDTQDRSSTPVPLLTPPASPVRVESEAGTTTVCEWPSNLAVDSAMTAAIDLRPLSPNSLQRQEEEEEKRIASNTVDRVNGKNRKTISAPQSTLTPLIRGICVKFD